jgi:hypothetical protein
MLLKMRRAPLYDKARAEMNRGSVIYNEARLIVSDKT